jgi:GNAT superfamily N-acetyltransferase
MKNLKVTYKSFLTKDHKFDLNVRDEEDFEYDEVFRVIARNSDGDEIGRADFGFHPDVSANVCWRVFVDSDYRRQGIASKMYDLASKHFGEEIEPFPGGHSKDAINFWSRRRNR